MLLDMNLFFANAVLLSFSSTRCYKPGRKKSLCMRVVPVFQQLVDLLRDLSLLCLEGMLLHGIQTAYVETGVKF